MGLQRYPSIKALKNCPPATGFDYKSFKRDPEPRYSDDAPELPESFGPARSAW